MGHEDPEDNTEKSQLKNDEMVDVDTKAVKCQYPTPDPSILGDPSKLECDDETLGLEKLSLCVSTLTDDIKHLRDADKIYGIYFTLKGMYDDICDNVRRGRTLDAMYTLKNIERHASSEKISYKKLHFSEIYSEILSLEKELERIG